MKTIFMSIIILFSTINSYCQQLTFVKDSIMITYMRNGYSTEHFRPKGKDDKNKLRQGHWKDYEVISDFEYVNIDGTPTQILGHFLLYGEGEFIDGKREGAWKLYVIEDKTLKKILQQEVSFINGQKAGPFKYFYPSGKIGVEGNYASGQQDGEAKIYYEDGKLYGTVNYINGLRTGRHTYFHHNGQIEKEDNYLNDTLNGLYRKFYSNGKLQETRSYKMGKEDGIYQYYYENGQLWVEREYKDGLLLNVSGNFDRDGNPRDKGTLLDGNGTVNYYTEDGKIYLIQTYKDGNKISEEEK